MSDNFQCSDVSTYTGDKCVFAKDYCGDDSILNYSSLTYCSSPTEQIFAISFLVIYLLYLIMLLASTADNYFVIELQTLSSILKLSDDVAGVTLLALGNGAPDVFTAVVGLSQDDFQLALSDLMGGGIFINTGKVERGLKR
jgi:solute carrier family 24 (sodium/potassium/calcium exchanger), member 6